MKRSEVNNAIKWAEALLNKYQITLPEFAYWTVDEWKNKRSRAGYIEHLMLGWDVTDYGMDTFNTLGGVLFTVRNGDINNPDIGVPYAEKYILLKEGQRLPVHFHYSKTEDIINRAGGILALKLYNAKKDERIDHESDVIVYRDGIQYRAKPGEIVTVPVGGSISLTPYMYHEFWALEGHGDLVVGEVSSINDDNTDNRFNPEMPRFGEIIADEVIVHPLCNEYASVLDK